MKREDLRFATRAIHGHGSEPNGALNMPIYQTSTFAFESCEQGGRRFAGTEEGYIYTRLGNPTTNALEERMANLEGGEAAAATASGMGAISALFWTIAGAGKHIVADHTLYGCTFRLLSEGLPRYGVEVSFVDTSCITQVQAALRENTVAVYLETPANPTLKVTDIQAVAQAVHQFRPEILVICDNTFATPYLQQPLALGADVVVHSATKYLNGHGDVIAGFVVGKKALIDQVKQFGIKEMTGSVLGPQEAFLVLRGLKTLPIRMEKHCANARAVAEFLAASPQVERVYYPGLAQDAFYPIAKRQMKDFGAMIAFEVRGGKEAGMQFVNALHLCTIAVSLGDAETLIEHPASMTHSPYTPEERAQAGIAEGLVRLSVGLEDEQDLLADLAQGLETLEKKGGR